MIPLRNVQLALPHLYSRRSYIVMVIMLLTVLMLTSCRATPPTSNERSAVTSTAPEIGNSEVEGAQAENPASENDQASTDANNGEQTEEESSSDSENEVAPAVESTPAPNKEIVLCMGSSPKSLFPFGDESLAAEALRHAIYEPLLTNVGYEYQAVGLEKLPGLVEGNALFQAVAVNEGDRVVDSMGNVVFLRDGVQVVDSSGGVVEYDGTAVEMEQMLVDFTLLPMSWSDGKPVTAEDSVYSFELASRGGLPYRSSAIAHTASYEATGERTLRWTGLPGHRDQTYFTNIWLPLPSHQALDILNTDLLDEGSSGEMRLSSGPFVIDEWREDGSLVLTRNPHYYRQEQGLPFLDKIVVRFGNGEVFLAGEQEVPCDVITSDALSSGNLPLLETAAEMGDWDIRTAPGVVFENIAFGVDPVTEYAERRPDWFEDSRVRQAMVMCTDRERMVEEFTQGHGQVIHSYLSPDHPLTPEDLQEWPYDPDKANALLDEAGYLDFAEDGRRQDVSSGVPMTITLGTNSESSMRLRITEMMRENMADCGIPVETYDQTAGTWYASGPQGRLFGRRFDLASFAWLAQVLPDCGLYTGSNITGPEEFGFGGWQNVNVTGWSNERFNEVCDQALDAMPGGEGYEAFQQEALRIFADEVPAIPLFTNYKIAAVGPRVLGVDLDSSQRSLLWNIFEWDLDE